ncbi:hypothetical protein J6590_022570 [Homalodisca vitripennis]|nr:hypothetical protein J6590_022570 [Homalodisca vitripennis]
MEVRGQPLLSSEVYREVMTNRESYLVPDVRLWIFISTVHTDGGQVNVASGRCKVDVDESSSTQSSTTNGEVRWGETKGSDATKEFSRVKRADKRRPNTALARNNRNRSKTIVQKSAAAIGGEIGAKTPGTSHGRGRPADGSSHGATLTRRGAKTQKHRFPEATREHLIVAFCGGRERLAVFQLW